MEESNQPQEAKVVDLEAQRRKRKLDRVRIVIGPEGPRFTTTEEE